MFEFDEQKSKQNFSKHGIDFPEWMVKRIEKETLRLGVTRQAIIKIWLSERLEHIR